MAQATGRKPTPNKCGDDWKTTECPRIAIVTSASENEAAGNEAFNNDLPTSLSYRSLYSGYGFSPKHVSVHIDNYVRTTNLSNTEAQLNFDILKQADVIFFNGGDQSRHARCWLNDDGSYNPIMKMVADRARNNEVILGGTSAGSMIMCSPTYGGGLTYGHLYFAAKVGLAPKQVADGGVNGTHLDDVRNGTKGLQYSDNGGMMPGFNFTPFLVDTHVNARGRVGRIVPAMVQTKF
jgi:cyanophycinase